MAMELLNKIIETYKLEDGFFCEVSYEDDGTKTLWLYHKDYGIKEMMFGMYFDDRAEIEKLIENNWKEYAYDYMEEYFD